MHIAILGGDARGEYLAALLAQDGHAVACFGLSKRIEKTETAQSPQDACERAELVIGPTPLMKNGFLNAPSLSRPLPPGEMLALLKPGTRFAAGAVPEPFRAAVRAEGADCFDFMDDEALAQANAVPSAEGAIGLAMGRMDITLAGCSALVLGYGRIGKILARMLRGIGAHATVYARREEVLERAWQEGSRAVGDELLDGALSRADCVFNTIPSPILTAKRLENVRPECVILDLASAPGGTDFEAAKALGLNASLDLGLPGRFAPRSAALYMKQALNRLPPRERNT